MKNFITHNPNHYSFKKKSCVLITVTLETRHIILKTA